MIRYLPIIVDVGTGEKGDEVICINIMAMGKLEYLVREPLIHCIYLEV